MLKQYIYELTQDYELGIKLTDLDEEWENGYHVVYGDQLLTNDAIFEPTGEPIKIIETYRDMVDIKNWQNVKIQFENDNKSIVNLGQVLIPYCLKKD